MLQASELFTLARDLAHRKVLSIYLDNRVTDPARRHAWRAALTARLRAVREEIADAKERAAFDQAGAFLKNPLPPPGGMWGAPGWVAFATPDGPVFLAELPRRPETSVAWRQGLVIGPYLRALKHHRPVIVALVQSSVAKLYRYSYGRLEALEEIRVSPDDCRESRTRRSATERGGRAYPAPRSAVTTEIARRRQDAEFHRLAAALAARLTLLAGRDGWILLGGAQECSRPAREALPRRVHDRALVSADLSHAASTEGIVRAAKRAARELRGRRGREIVSRIVGRAGHRATAGVPALKRALHVKAVDLLLVSPRFLQLEGDRAERLLQAALVQGAEVEVLSGDSGILLDRVAEGVAARLRFTIDAPRETASQATAAPLAPQAS
jgi:hypothetical protein